MTLRILCAKVKQLRGCIDIWQAEVILYSCTRKQLSYDISPELLNQKLELERFSNDLSKNQNQSNYSDHAITTGINSTMNQSQSPAITCNSLEAREKSHVRGANGFGFDSHWLTITVISRAVLKWLSKVITWLRLLCLVIGSKDSHQFFTLWESKPKPTTPCTHDFSRATSELQVIVIGSLHCLLLLWLVGVISLVLALMIIIIIFIKFLETPVF